MKSDTPFIFSRTERRRRSRGRFCRAFDRVVDFAGGGGGRERDAELVAEIESQAEILVHQAQRKAGFVVAAQHDRSFYVEDARSGHAGLHDFDEFFSREASAGNQCESFGKSVDLKSQKEIHGELNGLSGAVGPEVKKFFAHGGEHRAVRLREFQLRRRS